MIEAVTNAGFENLGHGLANRWLEPFMNHVAAQGQGKTVVLAAPPDAEVFAHNQSLVFVRELAFVDDESHVCPAVADGFENPVERHDDIIQARSAERKARSFLF